MTRLRYSLLAAILLTVVPATASAAVKPRPLPRQGEPPGSAATTASPARSMWSKLARGTIRMTADVNENDEIERGGPINCNSGAVL